MWTALVASIMIAFGLFILYKLFEVKKFDKETFAFIIVSLLLIVGGGWLLLSSITLQVILRKIGGILCILVGGFLVFKFPGHADYGIEGFMNVSVLIGLIFLILGVWLVLF